jgi:transposase InsO family protein
MDMYAQSYVPPAYQQPSMHWRDQQIQQHAFMVAQNRAQQFPQYQLHQQPPPTDDGAWLADSGSSGHMTPHERLFDTYTALTHWIPVEFGGGQIVPAIGFGSLTLPNGIKIHNVLHVPELAVNLLSISAFLSDGMDVLFRSNGRKVVFTYNDRTIMTATQSNNLFVLDVTTDVLGVRVQAYIAGQPQTAQLWHKRFGHLGYASLANMQRLGLIPGCTITPAQFMQAAKEPCEPCIQAKATRVPHATNEDKTDVILGLVSFDMTGPVSAGMNGEVYLIAGIDCASDLARGAAVKSKSEATQFVIDTIILWERQVQGPGTHYVQRVRTDNGGEFCNATLDKFLYERGIVHETTTPYTSAQNGRVERLMRTIMSIVRSLLACAKLSNRFWAFAAMHAFDMHNWSVSAHGTMSPFARFYGRPVPKLNMKPFGCDAWVLLPHEHLKKLDDRVRAKGTFIGYKPPAGSQQYLVLVRGKIYASCNVTFDERAVTTQVLQVPIPNSELHPDVLIQDSEHDDSQSSDSTDSVSGDTHSAGEELSDDALSSLSDAESQVSHLPDDPFEQRFKERDNAIFVLPQVLDELFATEVAEVEQPHSPPPAPAQSAPASRAASRRTKNPNWRVEQGFAFAARGDVSTPVFKRVTTGGTAQGAAARLSVKLDQRGGMQPSIRQRNNKTGEVWSIPPALKTDVSYMPVPELPREPGDMRTMPRTIEEALARPDADKWRVALEIELNAMRTNHVYQLSTLPDGGSAVGCRMIFDIKQPSGRYKCRLVAQGFSQVYGVDYDETYAPVASMTTLRVFYATCARYNLAIRQLDVSTAFLHAQLDEKVYMKQLTSLRTGSANEVWELFKAIYGLKQAPRAWNKHLSSKLKTAGYTQSDADPSLWLLHDGAGDVIAACLCYVDDLLIASHDSKLADSLIAEIASWWPCTVQAADRFLGIEVTRDTVMGTLTMHQDTYIQSMVSRYGCADEHGALLPLPPSVHFTKNGTDMGEFLPEGNLYRNLVGSLNHLSQCTRPDITYAVGLLSRFLSVPRLGHWGAAIHVLRYVKRTSKTGITFGTGTGLTGWGDASYQKGPDNKSTSGWVFVLHGGAVAWGSKLQTVTALSTTEAEVYAAGKAARVAIFLSRLLTDMQHPVGPSRDILSPAILIYGDNQAALCLLKERRLTQQSQHIETIDCRLRQWVEASRISFEFVPTRENWADCLTKALPRPALQLCMAGMGMRPIC